MPVISYLSSLASRSDSAEMNVPCSAKFTLDSSGVAGFFGGEGAVSGMATVHLLEGRRWLGWYNSPGAHEIAKQYGRLANSRLWDGLFPGGDLEPAELFELDGKVGPSFLAARSGTVIPQTGHLAYLVARKTRNLHATPIAQTRRTTPASIVVIDLPYAPDEIVQPPLLRTRSPVYAFIPVLMSCGACVLCAVFRDWYCFACIALGIFASGMACLIIGSGVLLFTHPKPANGAPNGDGILMDKKSVIILRGEEGAVNSLTRGAFSLQYEGTRDHCYIGYASVLLTVQFLTQLLLIPQGTLFGQLMFISSLAVSWMYTTYLSSLDKEELQTKVLFSLLRLNVAEMRKYTLGTRTAMAVFTCLALQTTDSGPMANPRRILDELIPNDTHVWQLWKALVARRLSGQESMTFIPKDWEIAGLTSQEEELLKTLLTDAADADRGWQNASKSLSGFCASPSSSDSLLPLKDI